MTVPSPPLLDSRWFDAGVYETTHEEKQAMLLHRMHELCTWHYEHCLPYKRLLNAQNHQSNFTVGSLEDLPFVWSRLFKIKPLKSIDSALEYKRIVSSGTSGAISQIFLDKQSAILQTKTLTKTLQHWVGNRRLPMIVIDTPETMNVSERVTARTAGVVGLSMFASKKIVALKADGTVDVAGLTEFMSDSGGVDFLVFGFTYIVWEYFLKALQDQAISIDLSKAILFHSGGWKKMVETAVSPETFRATALESFGIQRLHNFYGMAEQTGLVHVECELGYLHAPVYGDVIIRDQKTFQRLEIGHEGLVQVFSVLPTSYPGHSILTEDLGTVFGIDDCPCGRLGTRFKIHGRLPKSVIKGCSDTFTGFRA